MEAVHTHHGLRDEYMKWASACNNAAPGSGAERYALGVCDGIKTAMRTAGIDFGTMLIEADLAAIEEFGEVHMTGGILIK